MNPYIIDLDNCLIFTSYSEIKGLELISKKGYHYLYHRPHLTSFLKFLVRKKYDIIFYTSSKSEYAKWIVKSFGLENDYLLYTRAYTIRKTTVYGEIYLKSLKNIKISSSTPIPVLDDRPDLWDEDGIELNAINPWCGELHDTALSSFITSDLKKNLPKLSGPPKK